MARTELARVPIYLSNEHKQDIKEYLKDTYEGSMSEFFRRAGFEKIANWKKLKREEERREEEHRARLAQAGI